MHPNVDKRSFIRAKQSQIHAEREQRRQELALVRHERTVTTTLERRLTSLTFTLGGVVALAGEGHSVKDAAFQLALQGKPAEGDELPAPPEGVDGDVAGTTYTDVVMGIIDEVHSQVLHGRFTGSDPAAGFLEGMEGRVGKMRGRLREMEGRIGKLEEKDAGKITKNGL